MASSVQKDKESTINLIMELVARRTPYTEYSAAYQNLKLALARMSLNDLWLLWLASGKD